MTDSGNSKKQIHVKKLFIKNYNPARNSWSVSPEMKLQELKDYCVNNGNFIEQCIEIGIEKGLCYVKKNKKVLFLVDSDGSTDDFLKFLDEKYKDYKGDVESKNDLVEKNNINNLVFVINNCKYEIEAGILDEICLSLQKQKKDFNKLLEAYKNCDEKVKVKFKKSIALLYYIYTRKGKDLEDYYFIAKGYLSEDNSLRDEFCADYLNCYAELSENTTHKLRRLFQYEDYLLKVDLLKVDLLNKEKIKYILESGVGKISKTNDKYNVIYKSNTLECDSRFFLECIRELRGNNSIEEDDLKKYI